MAIDKKIANSVLTTLDRTASKIQHLIATGKIEPRAASALILEIDGYADRFQVAAFGADKLAAYRSKVSKVLQKDSDEKFMDTFDNPNKVIQSDADEAFMKEFDTDNSSDVTDRDEHSIREVSEHADGTKKQPSWARGPAGKSTRQGAEAPKPASPPKPAAPARRWSR